MVISRRYHRLRQVLDRRQPDLTVLMEDVHKPHNLSAVMRTCDAVGIFEMHAVTQEAELPTFHQVAQGTEKWVKLREHDTVQTAIEQLHQEGFAVYAAHFSETAVPYRQVDYTRAIAILLGTEKDGVSEEAAALVDGHINVPMMGMVKSLNVSVAAAIILFEAQQQRIEAGLYRQVRIDPAIYQQVMFEWSYPEIAAIYRHRNEPYPMLGPNGDILDTDSIPRSF